MCARTWEKPSLAERGWALVQSSKPCGFLRVQVGLEELGPGDGLGSCESNASPFSSSVLGAQ